MTRLFAPGTTPAQKLTRGIGALFIAGGLIYLGLYVVWVETRNLEPVRTNLSLVPGRTTYTFTTNVKYTYLVELQFDDALPRDKMACALGLSSYNYGITNHKVDCSEQPSLFDLQWALSVDSRPVAHFSSDENRSDEAGGPSGFLRYLGSFKGEAGRTYVLTVDVKRDGRALSKRDPLFHVWVAPLYAEGLSVGLIVRFLAAGGSAVIGALFFIASYRKRRTQPP
jgi:hypothetical protein